MPLKTFRPYTPSRRLTMLDKSEITTDAGKSLVESKKRTAGATLTAKSPHGIVAAGMRATPRY